ncbi:MAG: HlyD family efflux transporter periplasmic adaptor subunit [Candidatus Omnitrophica bacterium]|nr:HlyD family efflux transporter periplasmic adaptor subunit [Candidatus Omnitrophota bacterium]
MRKINKKAIIVTLLVFCSVFILVMKKQNKSGSKEIKMEITPAIGTIENYISTTGTVLPKNRLEIKPPVSGRIESILVKEGDIVKSSQVLGWMSSTDRAALLDAARGKGEETLQYWQETYKPIPLIAPIDGEVIVATIQPGQAVLTVEAVVVLSDRLIVRAQVDETDIGKIKKEGKAFVTLDAYPQERINAVVSHIYYESKTVSNVTVYEVDLLSEELPAFFRSGMNANIDFIEESRSDVLTVPLNAVQKEKEGNFVMVKDKSLKGIAKKQVVLGISDEKNVEIVSGIDLSDKIIVKTKKYELPENKEGGNPFMPNRRKQ